MGPFWILNFHFQVIMTSRNMGFLEKLTILKSKMVNYWKKWEIKLPIFGKFCEFRFLKQGFSKLASLAHRILIRSFLSKKYNGIFSRVRSCFSSNEPKSEAFKVHSFNGLNPLRFFLTFLKKLSLVFEVKTSLVSKVNQIQFQQFVKSNRIFCHHPTFSISASTKSWDFWTSKLLRNSFTKKNLQTF